MMNPTSPATQFVDLDRLGREHAESFRVEGGAVPPEANSIALAQRALKHAGEHDDAAVGIEPGVENQRLQPVVGRSLGRRDALHDGFEHVGDALAGLGADEDGVGGIEADGAFDHFFGARNVGALQIDLVDDGNDFEAVIDGEIGIGQRLGFDSLRGVDDEQRAFAGGQRARDFVGKIHVAGSVDQVELVGLAVVRGVHHADGVGLDGDAALAFEVHGVEDLGLHFARGERSGELQQAVGERGFAVVDVRDDREIADEGGSMGEWLIFDSNRGGSEYSVLGTQYSVAVVSGWSMSLVPDARMRFLRVESCSADLSTCSEEEESCANCLLSLLLLIAAELHCCGADSFACGAGVRQGECACRRTDARARD